MRAREFLIEVSLANLAKTPRNGTTLGDAVAQKMVKKGVLQDVQDVTGALELLSAADPTSNNTMTRWLSKMYLDTPNFIVPEDIDKNRNLLTKFMHLGQRNNLKPEHTNLDSFKTPGDLFAAMRGYGDDDTKSDKQKSSEGLEFIIKSPGFNVTHTSTYEANRSIGRGTHWCTAADSIAGRNYFKDYNADGPLYQIILGNGKDAKKFQYHYESDQFLDFKDAEVSQNDIALLSKNPNWAKFLNMQIEEHYGKYFHEA